MLWAADLSLLWASVHVKTTTDIRNWRPNWNIKYLKLTLTMMMTGMMRTEKS